MSTLSTTNLKNPSSGSNNIVLNTDGSTTIPTLSATDITGTTIQGTIKSGTAVASTSGTAIDFTGIPSWVKRVTVMLAGVSTSGTSNILLQAGSGSFSTSGYLGSTSNQTGGGIATISAGFLLTVSTTAAANLHHGVATLALVTGNTWVEQSIVTPSNTNVGYWGSGSIALSGTLNRIRITTVNGTDTFDAGTINILYEG